MANEDIQQAYTDAVFRNLRKFAKWEPGQSCNLGDYGTLEGTYFDYWGNLEDKGIDPKKLVKVEEKDDMEPDGSYVFTTAGEKGIGSAVVVNTPIAKASFDVSFSAENAIQIHAIDAVYEKYENLEFLEKELQRLEKTGEWDRKKFVVVGSVMKTGPAIVLMSTSGGSKVEIEATSKDPKIPLPTQLTAILKSLQLGVELKVNQKQGSVYAKTCPNLSTSMRLYAIKGFIFSHKLQAVDPLVRIQSFAVEAKDNLVEIVPS